jgi:phytoene/squalene synthetase
MIPLFFFAPEGFDLNDCAAVLLSKSDHSRPVNRVYLPKAGYIDHNESMRKFERLMGREADHAHDATTELEALISLLPPRRHSGSQV